ncbi:hypothetical protein [Dictyobacter kobayashii]|uniref:Uncharacterized protein n=1 Tax=Dictyobacter kobayashii TaxID=2014872 RepID=A0A402AH74_9CHLR|nr:hypothetical protein [Dictyobacter kobayashii]GCE18468.1 hypothetical protein KDK_22680 [Dictyobacter kobayashii]
MEQDKDRDFETGSKHVANERDLAEVGGGSIPDKGDTGKANNQTETAAENTAADRGVANDTDTAPPDQQSASGATGASDQPDQGALGGRTPGQANKSIGDMDSPREHRSIENTPIDPMTSRAPDKVNQKAEQKH